MRRLALAAVSLLVCQVAVAQHFHHTATPASEDELRGSPCAKEFAPAVLNDAFQKVNWPVLNITEEAQKFFNQGMTQYYGFNYEEALRNFRAAAAANVPSKKMAMASWGIALAAGPNINLGMDHDCHVLAQLESKNAVDLASKQGAIIAPDQKELIEALPLRYAYPMTPAGKDVDPETAEKAKKALTNYSVAMGNVWKNSKNEANVGALYAESMIELHPWGLYDKDGSPEAFTPPIVDVLSKSIAHAKDAVGANHYLIHAIEGSSNPGAALESADWLPKLAPKLGHLVHMPSHIYLLLGEYEKSVDGNEKAASVDVDQYAGPCSGSYETYSKSNTCPQIYYGHYLSHNYFFGSVSATFNGQSEKAVKLACDTRNHVERFVAGEPGLQRYMTAPLMTLVMNRNWPAILEYPEPLPTCYIQKPFEVQSGCYILRAIWHWARGMALASVEPPQIEAAKAQYKLMRDMMALIKPPTPDSWGNNSALDVLKIGREVLKARDDWAAGEHLRAIEALKLAVVFEDDLKYDEPPQWFAPVRESLGGAYLQVKDYSSAKTTFQEELRKHPKSGRALYGRILALWWLGEPTADALTDFCAAWTYADYTMSEKDLWLTIDRSSDDRDDSLIKSLTLCKRPKPEEPFRSTCGAPILQPKPASSSPKVTSPPAAESSSALSNHPGLPGNRMSGPPALFPAWTSLPNIETP